MRELCLLRIATLTHSAQLQMIELLTGNHPENGEKLKKKANKWRFYWWINQGTGIPGPLCLSLFTCYDL